MRTPVKYLNITKLSQYRKDAHPTVYTSKQGRLLTKEQREKPQEYADCNHWCLPGLPDTWNSLLFTSISMEASRNISQPEICALCFSGCPCLLLHLGVEHSHNRNALKSTITYNPELHQKRRRKQKMQSHSESQIICNSHRCFK